MKLARNLNLFLQTFLGQIRVKLFYATDQLQYYFPRIANLAQESYYWR